MKTLNKKIVFLTVLFLFNFAIVQTSSAIITRSEMMNIAESYKSYIWTPTEDNICNNKCCTKWNEKGKCVKEVNCFVNTPDRNTNTTWAVGKGWKAEQENEEWVENISVPYQWGGCSSIEVDGVDLKNIKGYGDFKDGVESRKCAGDFDWSASDLQKAVGIDCSGFISRCWNQGTKYGTSTIPRTFRELGKEFEFTDKEKYQSMGKGDAFNKKGHVMLCVENNPFTTEDEININEASSTDWKVSKRKYTFNQIGEIGRYKPYSFYKQIDIDLIIDRSGSMGWNNKMTDAKKAAAMFVSMMGERDKIGVVSFNDKARIDYELTEITEYSKDDPSEIKQAAISAISGISARDGTSIGAGMQMGFDQLKTYGVDSSGNKDDVRVMILMSDGRSSSVDSVLDKIVAYNNSHKNNKIKVCTIGFGEGADQKVLSNIANKTDCSYQYATNFLDLYFTYRSLQMEVAGEDMLKLSNKLKILKDEIIRHLILVDSTVGTATFAIAWPGSDLDLTLIRPDGTTIDHDTDDPDVEFIGGDTYESYKINAPMHGKWEMVIKGVDVSEEEGSEGEEFIITVSGENAMIFEADLDKSEYEQGEKITVTVSAEDSVTETPYPQYIHGMSVSVEVTNPAQMTSTLILHDDGVHNDDGANDGVYANTFSNTARSGSYIFNVKASGNTNRAGDPFTREKSITTFVAGDQLPDEEAKSIKIAAVGKLEGVKTGDEKVDRKIDDVIKNITKSLQEDLWQDETHLDPQRGNKVFVSEMIAVTRIQLYLYFDKYLNSQKLPGDVADVFRQVSKDLIEADRIITQVILDDARNMSAEEELITKAEKEIEQAQEYENSDPAKAVKHYWQSWKYSQKAMKEAGKK